MVNHPAEIVLNFTAIVAKSGFVLDLSSLLLVEYRNESGIFSPVKHATTGGPYGEVAIPFRFHKDIRFNPVDNAVGTLAWTIDGRTTVDRLFYLYFSALPTAGTGLGLHTPNDPRNLGLTDSNYWIQRGMTFFGFDPGEQVGWPDVDEIEVVGLHNGTSVKVFNITNGPSTVVTNSTTINRGELWRCRTPDGMYFKVLADKPVLASVSSAMNGGGSAKTFYPSSDRNLVGRDFIFAPYNGTQWHNRDFGLQFYGVEESRVSIWDMAGNHIKELDVRRDNHTQVLGLKAGTIYHAVSNGDVLIEQEAINGFSTLPSVFGSPVGRKFFGSVQDFDGMYLLINSYENSNVTIVDMDYGDTIVSTSLNDTSGKAMTIHLLKEGRFKVTSTGDISVLMGSTEGGDVVSNMGDDVTFAGGRDGGRVIGGWGFVNPGPGSADRQYPGPNFSGIVFAFANDTVATDGSETVRLEEGGHSGRLGCSLTATRPVSCMVLGRGYSDKDAQHRWNDWGTYLAGALPSPRITVGRAEAIQFGIVLYPSPSEGAVNDTMFHAVEPGRSTTFRISVKDIGFFQEEVFLKVGAVPNNWTTSLDRAQVSVGAGQVAEISLSVTVPAGALKDTRVNVSVRGETHRGDQSTNDTVYAEVMVDPVYFPQLEGETVKHVDPGRTAMFNLTVTNMGNAHDDIELEFKGMLATGWEVEVVPAKIGLEPSKNASLRLNVTAPGKASAGESQIVDVVARSNAWTNRTHSHRTQTIVNRVFGFNATVTSLAKVKPGDQATLNLTLQNLGNGADSFSFTVSGLGNGWSTGQQPSLGLGAGKSAVLPIHISIPGKDPATGKWREGPGNRTLTFNITDEGGIAKKLSAVVQVVQVFSVALSAEQYDVTINSTGKAIYILHVLNTGNGNDTYRLSTDSRGTFDKANITVGPGGDGQVVLTVPPPTNRARYATFNVTALSLGKGSASVTLSVRADIPKTGTSVSTYSCLWIVLVVALIFAMIKIIQGNLKKRRHQ